MVRAPYVGAAPEVEVFGGTTADICSVSRAVWVLQMRSQGSLQAHCSLALPVDDVRLGPVPDADLFGGDNRAVLLHTGEGCAA